MIWDGMVAGILSVFMQVYGFLIQEWLKPIE